MRQDERAEEAPDMVLTTGDGTRKSIGYRIWRALKEFLAIPILLLTLMIGLSLILYILDRNTPTWLLPMREWIRRHIFSTPDTTGAFLGVVAGGMFTQTSIVVSMLLLVLQQTASNMGNAVYDQFLRRHRNQVYAGYVIGALTMALVLQATIKEDFNPVLGASVVLITMVLAVALLVWFLYSTIRQMRPEVIVEAIYQETDEAREDQRELLAHFRRESLSQSPRQVVLGIEDHGYLARLDLETIEDCLQDCGPDVEVVFEAQIGAYLAYRDAALSVRAADPSEAEKIARCLGNSLRISNQRDLEQDPGYGLKQLETIGWTDTSTAKNNPEVGLLVANALRTLASRWLWEEGDGSAEGASAEGASAEGASETEKLPVVYDEEPIAGILSAWESLLTVASESMQHEIFAETLLSIADSYPDLSPGMRARADRVLMRGTSAMGDHVLTEDLDSALSRLIDVLEDAGSYQIAGTIGDAQRQLAASLGTLANRSTRVKQSSDSGS